MLQKVYILDTTIPPMWLSSESSSNQVKHGDDYCQAPKDHRQSDEYDSSLSIEHHEFGGLVAGRSVKAG